VALGDHPTMAQMPKSATPAEIVKGVEDSSTGTRSICASITKSRIVTVATNAPGEAICSPNSSA
jgi:hypothetical protein